jgi:hypothetical protein
MAHVPLCVQYAQLAILQVIELGTHWAVSKLVTKFEIGRKVYDKNPKLSVNPLLQTWHT